MTTTAQTIVTRAVSFSALNTPLASDRAEMLSRIRADQQAVFSSVASLTRDYFQTTASVTSTVAASGRTIDLSAVTPPIERILQFVLSDGREVSQVDVLDTDAELAPRYTTRGQTLVEVSNDWSTTSSAAITGTLTYVYGATDIDPDGAYTQLVTVPDAWVDLLVLPLALYLFQKDPGRDAAEGDRLAAKLDSRQQEFVAFLSNYGGIASRRFDVPSPRSTPSQKK